MDGLYPPDKGELHGLPIMDDVQGVIPGLPIMGEDQGVMPILLYGMPPKPDQGFIPVIPLIMGIAVIPRPRELPPPQSKSLELSPLTSDMASIMLNIMRNIRPNMSPYSSAEAGEINDNAQMST